MNWVLVWAKWSIVVPIFVQFCFVFNFHCKYCRIILDYLTNGESFLNILWSDMSLNHATSIFNSSVRQSDIQSLSANHVRSFCMKLLAHKVIAPVRLLILGISLIFERLWNMSFAHSFHRSIILSWWILKLMYVLWINEYASEYLSHHCYLCVYIRTQMPKWKWKYN